MGSFEGDLYLIDHRSKGNPQITLERPHVDAISSVVRNPTDPNIFATNARKDDFTYVWDIRKIIDEKKMEFLYSFH